MRSPVFLGGDGSENDDARNDFEHDDSEAPLTVEDRLASVFDNLDVYGIGEVDREQLIKACRDEFPRAAIRGTPAVEASEDAIHRFIDAVVLAIRAESAINGSDVITLQEFKDCFPDECIPSAAGATSFSAVVEEGVAFLGFTTSPPPTAVVNTCLPLSWAEEEGIMPGDQLVALNGTPTGHCTKAAFDQLMCERPLHLDFERNEEQAEQWRRMRSEMMAMNMKQIKAAARDAGVTEDELDNADDDDIPKATIIELIISRSEFPGNRAAVGTIQVADWPSPFSSSCKPGWGKFMAADGEVDNSSEFCAFPVVNGRPQQKRVSFVEEVDVPPPLTYSPRAAARVEAATPLHKVHQSSESRHVVRSTDLANFDDTRSKSREVEEIEDDLVDFLDPDDPFYGLNRWFRKICGSFASALKTALVYRKTIAERIGHLMGHIHSTPGERSAKAFGRELSEAWMEVPESVFLDMLERLREVDGVKVRAILVYLEWAVQFDPHVTMDNLFNMWKGIPDGACQRRMRGLRQMNPTSPVSLDSPLELALQDVDLNTRIDSPLLTDPTERDFLQMIAKGNSKGELLSNASQFDDDLDSIDKLFLDGEEDQMEPGELLEAQKRLIEEVCDRLSLFYGSIAEGFRTMVHSSDGCIDLDAFCAHLGFFRKSGPPLAEAETEEECTAEYEPLAVESFKILDYDRDGHITALDWMHAFSAILGADDYRLGEIKAERRRDMFRRDAGDHMKNIIRVAVVGQKPMIRDFSNDDGELTGEQLASLVREGLSMDSIEIPDEEILFLIELLDDDSGVMRVSDLMDYAMSDESPEEFVKRRKKEAQAAISGEELEEETFEKEQFEDEQLEEYDEAQKVTCQFSDGLQAIAKAQELVAKCGQQDEAVAKSLTSGMDAIIKAQKLAAGEEFGDSSGESAAEALNRGLAEIAQAQQAVAKGAEEEAAGNWWPLGTTETETQEAREAREVLTTGLRSLLKAHVLASNVSKANTEEETAEENIDDLLGLVLHSKKNTKSDKTTANGYDLAEEELGKSQEEQEKAPADSKANDLLCLLTAGKLKAKVKPRYQRFDPRAADRIQGMLKDAVVGVAPQDVFRMYDTDESGTLNVAEFKGLVRDALGISATDLPDEDIDNLLKVLDRDGSGSVSIEEASGFLDQGAAIFEQPAVVTEEGDGPRRPRKPPMPKEEVEKLLDEKSSARLRSALKEPVVSVNPQTWFKRFDKHGDGLLDGKEFTTLLRRHLRIPQSQLSGEDVDELIRVLDRNGDGISIEEAGDFILHGHAALKEPVSLGAGDAAPGRKKKKPLPEDPLSRAGLDKASARQIQSRLKAAAYCTDTKSLYNKLDKDRDGTMNVPEFIKFIRKFLTISEAELPDEQIEKLAKALDHDQNGSLNIDEFAAFVTFGVDVLKAGGGKKHIQELKLKRQNEEAAATKNLRNPQDVSKGSADAALWKVRAKLKAALGKRSVKDYFHAFDRDGSGELSNSELKMLVRVGLDISEEDVSDEEIDRLQTMLDHDNSGALIIKELTFFLEKGPEAIFSATPQEDSDAYGKAAPKGPRRMKKGALAGEDGLKLFQARLKTAAAKANQAEEGDLEAIIASYDLNGNGYLHVAELSKFIIDELRIPDHAFCDADIMELIYALGGKGRGVKAEAVIDFAEQRPQGDAKKAVLKSKPQKPAGPAPEPVSLHGEQGKRFFQRKLKLAVARQINEGEGDLKAMLKRYDPNGNDMLDMKELTRLIVHELHVPEGSFDQADVIELMKSIGGNPRRGVPVYRIEELVTGKKSRAQNGRARPRGIEQPHDPKSVDAGTTRRNLRKSPVYSMRAWQDVPSQADIHTRLYYDTTDTWDQQHVLKYGAVRPPRTNIPAPTGPPRPVQKQVPIDEDTLPRWGAGGVTPKLPKIPPPRVRARRMKAAGEAFASRTSSPTRAMRKAGPRSKVAGKDSMSQSADEDNEEAASATHTKVQSRRARRAAGGYSRKPDVPKTTPGLQSSRRKEIQKPRNKDEAATAIQAEWRGHQQRVTQKRNKSATIIQARWRGHESRAAQHQQQRSAGAKPRALGTANRPALKHGRMASKDKFRDEDAAAATIQAHWHGRKERSAISSAASRPRPKRQGTASLQGYDAEAVRRSISRQSVAKAIAAGSKEVEAMRLELQEERKQIGQMLEEFKDAAAAQEQERTQLQAALTQHEQVERNLRDELLRLQPVPQNTVRGHQKPKETEVESRQHSAAGTIQKQWRRRQEVVSTPLADAPAKGLGAKGESDDRSPSPGGPREMDEPEGEIGPRAEKAAPRVVPQNAAQDVSQPTAELPNAAQDVSEPTAELPNAAQDVSEPTAELPTLQERKLMKRQRAGRQAVASYQNGQLSRLKNVVAATNLLKATSAFGGASQSSEKVLSEQR